MKIDKEFQALIYALSAEEYERLEDNILRDGCRDALVVWQDELAEDILLDGHNRYNICSKHSIPYEIVAVEDIKTRDDAMNWMIDNQLGRRNLTDEQRLRLIGKRYKQEKKKQGGDRKSKVQIEPLINTAQKIAEQTNTSASTVKRAEKFSDGIDAINDISPTVKDEILSGGSGITKAEVAALADITPAQGLDLKKRVEELCEDEKTVIKQMAKELKKTHVSNNSGNNEWYTPKKYIDAVQKVLGVINLDPASSEIANKTVNAETYYTIDDDGLAKEWFGNVFLNPPYSSPQIANFAQAIKNKYQVEYDAAIVLVNNATETGWFSSISDVASAICFPQKRIKFFDAEGNVIGTPLQGQAFLYIGKDSTKFQAIFKDIGKVWVQP